MAPQSLYGRRRRGQCLPFSLHQQVVLSSDASDHDPTTPSIHRTTSHGHHFHIDTSNKATDEPASVSVPPAAENHKAYWLCPVHPSDAAADGCLVVFGGHRDDRDMTPLHMHIGINFDTCRVFYGVNQCLNNHKSVPPHTYSRH